MLIANHPFPLRILLPARLLFQLRREHRIRMAKVCSVPRPVRRQDDVLKELILSRIHILDELAALYTGLEESDSALLRKKDMDRMELILGFRRIISAMRDNPVLWEELAFTLDREKNGVATLLVTCFPKLPVTDRRLLLLLYSGVSSSTAGTLMRLPPATVRTRKARFLKRVLSSSLPAVRKEILVREMPKYKARKGD